MRRVPCDSLRVRGQSGRVSAAMGEGCTAGDPGRGRGRGAETTNHQDRMDIMQVDR